MLPALFALKVTAEGVGSLNPPHSSRPSNRRHSETRATRRGALPPSRKPSQHWGFSLRTAGIFPPPHASAAHEQHRTRKGPSPPVLSPRAPWFACQCEHEPSLLSPFRPLRYIVSQP